jgi:hypothetical protein
VWWCPARHRNNARQRAEECRYEAPSLDRSHTNCETRGQSVRMRDSGELACGKDKDARQEWRVKLTQGALPKGVGRPRASSLPGDGRQRSTTKRGRKTFSNCPLSGLMQIDSTPLFVTSWRRWQARICRTSIADMPALSNAWVRDFLILLAGPQVRAPMSAFVAQPRVFLYSRSPNCRTAA